MREDRHNDGFGRLAVRDDDDEVTVVRDEDPSDWVVKFHKSETFPARAWAENMVAVYNRRTEVGRGKENDGDNE